MEFIGWSHGKEKLGDTPDIFKGSFSANPLFDKPAPNEVPPAFLELMALCGPFDSQFY